MKRLYKIFHPEVFQGSLKKTRYFEGWYFKHVSQDAEDAFAVIPGISLSSDSHCFIQYIDGSGQNSAYFRYDSNAFVFQKKSFGITVGGSFFSAERMNLDLESDHLNIKGEFRYSDIVRFPRTLISPGIMGWYSYIPGMECNHGVVSINHRVSGSLSVNGQQKEFTGGKGYIEKDWGTSFPESWLWLQCNNFRDDTTSVMMSVAKIPWRKSFFIGFIAFISLGGKTEVFATYNGSKISFLKRIDESSTEIRIVKGSKRLTALISKSRSSILKAPVDGQMINSIKESLDSKTDIEYLDGKGGIYTDSGVRAGYEETEGIFSYF